MDVPEIIEARSRQPMWPFAVLVASVALLFWMVQESLAPDFAEHSSNGLMNALPPIARASFFGACALVCVFCCAIVLWRRLAPRVELVLGETGVESRLFWGPGFLSYAAITGFEVRGNFLYVHGADARGRKRRLIADVSHLDHPAKTLLDTLTARLVAAARD